MSSHRGKEKEKIGAPSKKAEEPPTVKKISGSREVKAKLKSLGGRTSMKSDPLAKKNVNSSAAPESSKKMKGKDTPVASTSVAAMQTNIKLDGERITIKFTARNMYFADVKQLLKLEEAREMRFLQVVKQGALSTSFMVRNGRIGKEKASTFGTRGRDSPVVEEYEMDFMNILNIPAFGNFSRMWIDVYFGKGPRSAAIPLVVDTGSATIWVNERVYRAALKKTNAKEGKRQSGRKMHQGYSSGAIVGQLYKDSISFFPDSEDKEKKYIKKQLFGVVDTEDEVNLNAKEWKEKNDILGVFGIGPRELTKNKIQSNEAQEVELPTVVDNMKDQKLISQRVTGIYLELPYEGHSDSNSADLDRVGTINGELHFGAPKTSLFNVQSLRWIPATNIGRSMLFYGVDLKLSYNGETIMSESPGIVDSGAQFIALPESVLDKYLRAIQNASGRPADKPVVRYDEVTQLYSMDKADYGLLKALEFNFVKGYDSVFKFSPSQQVYPPRFTKYLAANPKSKELFLRFKKLKTTKESRQFVLGLNWMTWYYHILDSSDTVKKVGIAEIDGHTSHVWKDLP